MRVNGAVYDLDQAPKLDRYKKHTVEVVVDRLVIRHHSPDQELHGDGTDPDRARLADSVETALKLGNSTITVATVPTDPDQAPEEFVFSELFACPNCGFSVGEIEPRNFSFNSPQGACPACTGLGAVQEFDPELVIPNRDLTLAEGAVQPWVRASQSASGYYGSILEALAKEYGFSVKKPVRSLTAEQLDLILYGNGGRTLKVNFQGHDGRSRSHTITFEGVIPNLKRRFAETSSDYIREEIGRYMTQRPCPTCGGAPLKPEALGVLIDGRSIVDVTRMAVTESLAWARALDGRGDGAVQGPTVLSERERLIARQVLKEIRERLGFLVDVGLDYLTLDRAANTLSGGEAQRIRLATQIGSSLMGVLYILDEPSIGLHQRDNARLIKTLERLRDIGNTLIVVEHDEDTMRAADWIIDVGPGAGEHGGRIVAEGPLPAIAANKDSLTGDYLSGRKAIPVPDRRRAGNGKALTITARASTTSRT